MSAPRILLPSHPACVSELHVNLDGISFSRDFIVFKTSQSVMRRCVKQFFSRSNLDLKAEVLLSLPLVLFLYFSLNCGYHNVGKNDEQSETQCHIM